MKRYVVLYLATLAALVALDFLFLGVVARGFFIFEVGDMLGEVRALPAVLFYALYVVGVLIFVSGGAHAAARSTLPYGAAFGLFCYATFDLTALALLRHWSWAVAAVDVSWGAVVTAVSSTAGVTLSRTVWCRNVSRLIRGRSEQPDPESRDSVTSAAGRSGCTASVTSSPAGRSSWPRRR